MDYRALVQLIFGINWLKTIRFNFHYFKPCVAIKLPAFVYRRTAFNALGGSITLKGQLYTGMLRIGMPIIGMQDHRFSRTVWQVWGG